MRISRRMQHIDSRFEHKAALITHKTLHSTYIGTEMSYKAILVVSIYVLYSTLTLYHTIPTFNDPKEGGLWNISQKGEKARNQHFLLFPKCFLPFPKQISIF